MTCSGWNLLSDSYLLRDLLPIRDNVALSMCCKAFRTFKKSASRLSLRHGFPPSLLKDSTVNVTDLEIVKMGPLRSEIQHWLFNAPISRLDIHDCPIAFLACLSNMPRLNHLGISGTNLSHQDCAISFPHNLHSLNLNGCRLSSSPTLTRLINSLPPRLERLDISSNFLLNDSILWIIGRLPPLLCYLDISNNCLLDVEVAQITRKLTRRRPKTQLVSCNMLPPTYASFAYID